MWQRVQRHPRYALESIATEIERGQTQRPKLCRIEKAQVGRVERVHDGVDVEERVRLGRLERVRAQIQPLELFEQIEAEIAHVWPMCAEFVRR